jgi:hypothetical protein
MALDVSTITLWNDLNLIPNPTTGVLEGTIVNTMNLVELGETEINLFLPIANPGDNVTVVVTDYTVGAGHNHIVKVLADPSEFINETYPFRVSWVLNNSLTLVGHPEGGWATVA